MRSQPIAGTCPVTARVMSFAFPGRDESLANRRSFIVNATPHLLTDDTFQCYASFEKSFGSTHCAEFCPDFKGMFQRHDTASMIIGLNGGKEYFENGTAGPALLAWCKGHQLCPVNMLFHHRFSFHRLRTTVHELGHRMIVRNFRSLIESAASKRNFRFHFSQETRTESSHFSTTRSLPTTFLGCISEPAIRNHWPIEIVTFCTTNLSFF